MTQTDYIWQPFTHREKCALIYEDQTWTYGDIDRISAKYAASLVELGINSGDRVAILAYNCPEYVFAIHALTRLGAVIVPLNTRLTPDELTYQIEASHVSLLIYGEAFAATVEAQSLEISAIPFRSLNTQHATFNTQSPSPDAPHAIIFTSGTTGKPKGATLSLRNQIASANASARRIGVQPDDRWLCVLPLYHVGGLAIIMRSALYGTAVVLHERFDVENVSMSLERDKVTLISLVPTMLYRLIEYRGDQPAPDTLRLVLLGGAAATPELVTQAQAHGYAVATTYGLSEACSQVATQTPEQTLLKPASVGKAQPGIHIRIIDETGDDVAQGEYGEIIIKGDNVMLGYDGNPSATAQTIRDGWLYTGDLGYFDTEGDLWLVQRRSDLIVSGGENVYPAEVEAAIRAHNAVKDVCVVGLPSAEWGQIVAAAIVPEEKTITPAEEIINHTRDHLAGYKIPRKIIFVDALPLTASGKIERKSVSTLFD